MVIKCIQTREYYDEELELAGDKLCIVTFSATWSGPCLEFDPTLLKLSDDNEDIHFVQADIDDSEELAKEFKVVHAPTFFFIKNKQLLERVDGLDEKQFMELIQKYR